MNLLTLATVLVVIAVIVLIGVAIRRLPDDDPEATVRRRASWWADEP